MKREFVEESAAAIKDTKVRLSDAFKDLKAIMDKVGADAEAAKSEDYANATKLVADIERLTFEPTETKEPPAPKGRVTVFGWKESSPEDELYQTAEKLGTLLAQKGYAVVNGGYYGTMEAVSKGARSVPGAVVEGVICPAIFPQRGNKGNAFLTIETRAKDYGERLALLCKNIDAYIVLPGKLGTLTELTMVWNQAFFGPGSQAKPLVAFRKPWEPIIKTLISELNLSAESSAVRFADTAEEAAQIVEQLLSASSSSSSSSSSSAARAPLPAQ